jgi:hypothetical protein
LLAVGGFSLAEEVPPVAVSHGTVRIQHRSDPTARVTHAGIMYVPDADGVISDVPIGPLADLAAHAFARVLPAIKRSTGDLADQSAPVLDSFLDHGNT